MSVGEKLSQKMSDGLSLMTLQLIGPFKAETVTGLDVSPRSKKARALLGILALAPSDGMSRSRVAGLLWDRAEPEQARNLLRGALHELRNSFDPVGAEIVQTTREHILLRRDRVTVDIDELTDAQGATTLTVDADRLLEGLENLGRSFDEWLSAARLSLKQRLRAVQSLAVQSRAAQSLAAQSRAAQSLAAQSLAAQSLAAQSLAAQSLAEQSQKETVAGTGEPGPQTAPPVPDLQPTAEPPRSALSPAHRSRTGIRIGVAPLRSFSGEHGGSTADALVHELSAALSEFRWISVSAPDAVAAALGPERNTQLAFSSQNLDFMLDGQIQAAEGKLKLRISLISAYEAAIVWTFKTVRDNSNLLAGDEIAAEVAARIDSHLLSSESHRVGQGTLGTQDAYALVMRAVRTACNLDPETFASSHQLLEEAVQLEPDRPMAHITTALFYLIAASQGWLLEPALALQRAEGEANLALSMDPSEAQAWAITGYVRSTLYRQPEEAVGLLRRSIEMNPNLPLAWHFSTGNYLLLGDLPQARACIARYEQLGPTGVHFFGNSALISLCMLEGNDEEAVRIGRTTLRMHPNFVAAYKPYLAALGHLALHDEAAAAYAELRRLEPTFSPDAFLKQAAFRRPEDRDRYAAGLALACR